MGAICKKITLEDNLVSIRHLRQSQSQREMPIAEKTGTVLGSKEFSGPVQVQEEITVEINRLIISMTF